MAHTGKYRAMVEKIIASGKHGPYAVARSDELGVVTFSLDPKVWREKHQPEPGDCVELSQVISHATKGRTMWRAKQAWAVSPQTSNSNSREQ